MVAAAAVLMALTVRSPAHLFVFMSALPNRAERAILNLAEHPCQILLSLGFEEERRQGETEQNRALPEWVEGR